MQNQNDSQSQIITYLECLCQEGNTQTSEAIQDCLYAVGLSVACLENLFDSWLWVKEDFVETTSDLPYALAMGEIEELLVHLGLIYND